MLAKITCNHQWRDQRRKFKARGLFDSKLNISMEVDEVSLWTDLAVLNIHFYQNNPVDNLTGDCM